MASHDNLYDVLILGGGPAALSAALTLARQLHRCVVLDSKHYRNQRAGQMHTVLTWDSKAPAEFRAVARENILEYYDTVEFEDAEITELRALDADASGDTPTLFAAKDKSGKMWMGRKVVLATGVQDVMLDIEGYEECWVDGIFHCLFCHGYEERNQASTSGILAIGDLANPMPALHLARNALQLTPQKVTIYTNGASDLASQLTATISTSKAASSASSPAKMVVDARKIARLQKDSDRASVTIHFTDGSTATESFLGHKPKTKANGPWAEQLGLEITPQGDVKTLPPFYQTPVRGVFAAGDNAGPIKIVTHALFTGAAVGAGVVAQLQAENWGQKGMV